MDLKPPSSVMAWLGPIALVNIFLWILVLTPESRGVFCSTASNCLTDWIGALSGWAACVAALATVAVMKNQMERQQRQIDFQLGDANPTAYAVGEVDLSFVPKVIIYVKNWNRRPVRIDRLLSPKSFKVKITKVILDGVEARGSFRWQGIIGEILAGRSDDGKAPVAELHIEAYRANGYQANENDSSNGWDIFLLRLRLECTKIDVEDEKFELDVTTKVLTC